MSIEEPKAKDVQVLLSTYPVKERVKGEKYISFYMTGQEDIRFTFEQYNKFMSLDHSSRGYVVTKVDRHE